MSSLTENILKNISRQLIFEMNVKILKKLYYEMVLRFNDHIIYKRKHRAAFRPVRKQTKRGSVFPL